MRTMPQFETSDGYQFAGSGMGGGSPTMPIASPTTLGGIKVGDNLSIDENGVLSASGGGANYVIGQEVDTGEKWVDDKPIYKQVYYYPNGLMVTNDQELNTDISAASISNIIKCELVTNKAVGGSASKQCFTGAFARITGNVVAIKQSSGNSILTQYITLFYTKS